MSKTLSRRKHDAFVSWTGYLSGEKTTLRWSLQRASLQTARVEYEIRRTCLYPASKLRSAQPYARTYTQHFESLQVVVIIMFDRQVMKERRLSCYQSKDIFKRDLLGTAGTT